MNYEELLRKYIAHVRMEEGTDFISSLDRNPDFTEEEARELCRLAGDEYQVVNAPT